MKQKQIAFFSLIFILLLLSSAGFLLVRQKPQIFDSSPLKNFTLPKILQPKPSPKTTPLNQKNEPVDQALTLDPTWKKYTSKDFGFSFAFPPEYTIKHVNVAPKKSIIITLANNENNQLIVEAKTKYDKTEITNFLGKKFDSGIGLKNGDEWLQFYLNGDNGLEETTSMRIQIEKNTKLYSITTTNDLNTIIGLINSFSFN